VTFEKTRALEAGWDQCAAFDLNSAPSLYSDIQPDHKDPSGIYLVLSHPCSLLHPSFETEKNLEYILGKIIDEPDANNLFGKNPRIFDITCMDSGVTYRFSQNYRGFISRKPLINSGVRKFGLSDTNRVDIKRWMSNRYIASALPDNFDIRIGVIRNKLKNIYAKGIGKQIRSVYVFIDEPKKDLDDDIPYSISIFYTLSNENYNTFIDNEDSGESLYEIFIGKVINLFNDIANIVLNESSFISESNLTIEQINTPTFIKWNLDSVSLGKPNSELAEPIQ
jgi:hypothetical protein